MIRRRWLSPALAIVAVVLFLAASGAIHAEEPVTIAGRIVNGTQGEPAPGGLEVILHVIRENGDLDLTSGATNPDGGFRFEDVAVEEDSTYALTASYLDVPYSIRLDPAALEALVELTVYQTVGSLDDIRVGADFLLLREIEGDSTNLAAFAVVTLTNGGDRTFVPDLTRPASMGFLRFSLGDGTSQPEVSSDLPGGEIISVGTGFALTAPVTPGAHQVTYRYLVPYENGSLELDRSFPLGAESFRLLLEEGLGTLRLPSPLNPLEPAESEGKSYRVWGATDLEQGIRLTLHVDGLPEAGALSRLGDAVTDGPYFKIGIPAAVGLVLASLLLYGLFARQAPATSTVASIAGPAGAASADGGEGDPHDGLARPEDLSPQGGVSRAEHSRRQRELEGRLPGPATTPEEG